MGKLFRRSGPARAGTSRRRRNRERGQAMVEFALVFPVFMLILAGVLDFGFMLYSRMTVINAAREGAHAVLADAYRTGPQTPSTVQGIPGRVNNVVLGVADGLNKLNVSTTTTCIQPGTTVPCTFDGPGTPSPSTADSGDSVNVKVSYVYKSFFPLLFGQTFDMSSTVQMVFE